MSGMFDHHEEMYSGAAQQVTKEVSALKAAEGDRPAQRAAGKRARAAIKEATEALRHMDMEARQSGPSERAKMQDKVRMYRNDIGTLQKDLEREELVGERQEQYNAQRARTQFGAVASDAQRAKLDATSGRLDKTTATLQTARSQLYETQDIAGGVMNDLGAQREQLLNAHGRVRETTQFTTDARSVLKQMGRRALTNKVILWFIILVLIAANGAVIYEKYIKKSKKNGN
jgi:vesicle transport through interaction with t-SNAREs 1